MHEKNCKMYEPYYLISESRMIEMLRLLRQREYCVNYAAICEQIIRSRPHSSTEAQKELQPSFDDIDRLNRKVEFYNMRMNMLQRWQSSMRDPERKIVCDILANGFSLVTKEAVDNANTAIRNEALDEAFNLLISGKCPEGKDNSKCDHDCNKCCYDFLRSTKEQPK